MAPSQPFRVLIGRWLIGGGSIVLVGAPWIFGLNTISTLTQFLTMLVLALMWNLLAGYADVVTVGQHAFVGIGAYALYGFAALAGIEPHLAILLAGLTTFGLALPAMAVVFRLRAAYLAVGTWVVAELFMLGAGKLKAFGGGSGVSLPLSVVRALGARPGERYVAIYWLALVLAAAAFLSTWLLLRSRVGLGLTAMRDNEEGAGSVGVNLVRARVLCFLWTAPFLGFAGAIITLQKLRISPAASFSIIDYTVFVIFNVVIGGVGSLEGPVLGTILFFVLREYLSDFGTWHLMLLGALSIMVILIEPRGLWGLIRRGIAQDLVPVSHRASIRFLAQEKAVPQASPVTPGMV
ncbi:MAG: branched-chain amino acid ABC transporter permease [Acetobacteraceae bacterium]|nr:branched-chain amino acid ABC transporter permease [Acetobacteraceae bacterium]